MVARALRPIDASGLVEQTWAGGRGRTTQLAVDAAHDPWHWRISIAQLEDGAEFSALPGVRRQFAPVDGSVELVTTDGTSRAIPRLSTFAFDGALAPACRMQAAPARALNLMLRGDADGELLLRPLLGRMIVLPRPHTRWLVYMLAGTATLSHGEDELSLSTADAAWIEPHEGRALVDGGGDIALVRITTAEHP